MWLDDLNRPIHAAAVNDKEFKLAWLVIDTMQARQNTSGLIQCRDNHGNFHRSKRTDHPKTNYTS
jgi:hypothetical protein